MKRRSGKFLKTVLAVCCAVAVVLMVCIIIVHGEDTDTYEITQYSDSLGEQCMFYTIRSESGKFVVIDGGFWNRADDVRKVISENGGKVDAWILTHPHPDHIGAFNVIYADPQGIEINKVYAVDVDYDTYKANAKDTDWFDTFQTFYDSAKTMRQLTYVHEGDDFDLIGLRMHVYNAYDDTYPGTTTDIANDGSMVFKLSGRENSILFLADAGKSRNDHLLNTYGKGLKADIVQMGHHGNSTLSDELYEDIGANTAFFDAPDWLINGEKYSTHHYIDLMESMGAKVLSFSSAPNTVEIQ